MVLIKIPVLLLFLTFFTACDLFSSKPDVTPKVTPESVNPESSSSPDRDQSVSPQPLPADSSAQTPSSGEADSFTTQVIKTTFSKEQRDFFKAVKEGDLQKVNLALEMGADPILPDEVGNTALIRVVNKGYNDNNITLLQRLLEIPSVKQSVTNTSNGKQAFWRALIIEPETMDLFFKAGIDLFTPDREGNNLLMSFAGDSSFTGRAMCYDLKEEFVKKLKEVLSSSLSRKNIDARNNKGETALFLVAKQICKEMVNLLLDVGADPTIPDKDGNTVFQIANRGRYSGSEIIRSDAQVIIKRLLEIPSIRQNISPWTRDACSTCGTYRFPVYVVLNKLVDLNDITTFQSILNTPDGQIAVSNIAKSLLIKAIKKGYLEFVNLLLEEVDVDPTIPDSDGNTLLMKASYLGHRAIVQRLLEIPSVKEGINLRNTIIKFGHIRSLHGTTAFFQAVSEGHLPVMNLLLEAAADPTIPDAFNNTPLMRASYSGYDNIVQRLLEIPAVKEGINLKSRGTYYNISSSGSTAFFQAVSEGHLPVMNLLLKEGADPTIPDLDGNTPLIRALSGFFFYEGSTLMKDEKREKQGNIVKQLLSLDAVKDPAHLNVENKKRENALSVVEKLLEQEPDAPLFLEIRRELLDKGALPPVEVILKKLVDLNDITTFQSILNTPAGQIVVSDIAKSLLIKAIKKGYLEFVNLLLEEVDVDPMIPALDGNTPLMKASYFGYKAIVQRLLEIPAVKEGINLRNRGMIGLIDLLGTTAFFQAVSEGHLPVMDLLLKEGADPTIPDLDGNTPLIEALFAFFVSDDLIKNEERQQQVDIVKRLLSLDAVKDPAHLNTENQRGENALSLVEKMLEKEPDAPLFLEIRKELLDKGALPPQAKSGKKAEKKKSLQTKKIDKNPPVTSKDKKKNQPFRETAQEEKKKIHSEESFWQRILSGLRKFFP